MDDEQFKSEGSPSFSFLDGVDGEIAFFSALMRARPVGMHRHFHVLTMRNDIYRLTGRLISVGEIWDKLKTCYDLDLLESIEVDGYDISGEAHSPDSYAPASPSPSENLTRHPYFRQEFSLPQDEALDALICKRRTRATASLPSSSPAPSPTHHVTKPGRGRGRGRSQLKNMAGLVGGDSDSSALTQESGDESPQRESIATGTDAATEDGDEEFVEAPGASPVASVSTRGRGKGTRGTRRGGAGGRGRGGSTAAARGTKKKKK
ncbi:hypothetical protein CERSUDRAFT_112132 [Gelatoporia subvermispora B]|uniref:Chromatin modification-related protein EAF7 n=1 Tax=Ceriporiopsis subvermispora (strain B) TaxID=914234 RepID=M2R5N0_CERS8|nr:hypothetical protein CERSUDRAFT_112132 [Gelatoporia subvermispora B]